MPLFYEKNLFENARVAIWKITEPESFFSEKVTGMKTIAHPKKRLQHLAGRYLLKHLDPGFPIEKLMISPDGKPYLSNGGTEFSISHCENFAGAILSKQEKVGLDLELRSPKLQRLSHKFMNDHERELQNSSLLPQLSFLTLIWSAKEAMFKWYEKGGIDFRKHLLINGISGNHEKGRVSATFAKGKSTGLMLDYKFFDDLCLVYLEGKGAPDRED